MNTQAFEQAFPQAGNLLRERAEFLGSNGGQPDDSRRGFGSVSQHYLIPTSNGWYAYEIVGSGGILSVFNEKLEQVYGRPSSLDLATLLKEREEKEKRQREIADFWHNVLGVK
jgi:hypothetical protein